VYQDKILDHYKHPRNFGELVPADLKARGTNPLCGDDITIYVRLSEEGNVSEVQFQGKGCAISQASASLLTEALKGLSVRELEAIGEETVLSLLGVPLSPARKKCAFLPLDTLKTALKDREST